MASYDFVGLEHCKHAFLCSMNTCYTKKTSTRWYHMWEEKLACYLCFQNCMFLCAFLKKGSFSYSFSLKSSYAV